MLRLRAIELLQKNNKTKYRLYKQLGICLNSPMKVYKTVALRKPPYRNILRDDPSAANCIA